MSKSTDELVKAVKTNKTKKGNNVKKTIIITVTVTILIISAFVATFVGGVKWANAQHNMITAKASEIASTQSKN